MFSEIYCSISGKVHGVGFRAYVESVARERGVTGWVKNNPVPDILKECIEDLQNGSVLSHVESVAVDWRTPKEQFSEFKILV
jgi:acylphosphatase